MPVEPQNQTLPIWWRQLLATATPRRIAIGYLLAITVGELLTTYIDPGLGLISHSLILVSIVMFAAYANDLPIQRLLAVLIIAPLIRLMSLSMPLSGFPFITWYIIISIPLFATAYVLARVLGYSWRKVGFNFNKPLLQLPIIASGIMFGLIEYLVLRPEPLFTALKWHELILPALILLIGTGLMEELVFRGIMQQVGEEILGKSMAILYTTLMFAVLHIGWKSVLDLLFVFIAGGMWGFAFMKTRSLLGITIAHGITNSLLFLIFPVVFDSPQTTAQLSDMPPIDWGALAAVAVMGLYLLLLTSMLMRQATGHRSSRKN